MSAYLDVLIESLEDTAKVLPLLFVVYYLIEIFEYKCAHKIRENKLLKGKYSPIIGSLLGSVPQCGFSVVATDLFSEGTISIGALIAVYIATSDEAVPMMFSNPKFIPKMLLLIGIKIVYAIIIGYITIMIYKLIFKNKINHSDNVVVEHEGCCHHSVESKSFDWVHPMLHCLKIAGFIFVINLIFGCVLNVWIGKEKISAFLSTNVYLQPLFSVLVGLIPNCASSVILTELYMLSGVEAIGLRFGALLAGLCVNAGLGLIMLIKENKNLKENIFIFSVLLVSGLLLGYGLLFIV